MRERNKERISMENLQLQALTFNTGPDFDGGVVGTAIAAVVKTITNVGNVVTFSITNPGEQGRGTMR